MEWIVRFVSTALTVGIVLLVAERFGRTVAGFCASLPTVTAPALAWLAHDHGTAFASDVAVAGTASCAMLAAFAFCYARASARGGIGLAIGWGLGGAMAMALPTWQASHDLPSALALSFGTWTVALVSMPRRQVVIVTERPDARPRSYWLTAVAAGVFSAAAVVAGTAIGAFAAGLLSSLPFISGAVTVLEHATHGPGAAANFLRGYVDGLLGKATFGALFALLVVPAGSALAMAIAFAGLGSLSLLTTQLIHRNRQIDPRVPQQLVQPPH